ncbi:MAG: hypothetical protein AAF850_12430 [Pseudomonadota bacterium]
MADGSPFNGQAKSKPKIAFTGEEFGFGYQAVGALIETGRSIGLADAGLHAVSKVRTERETGRGPSRDRFDFGDTIRQPLRSKEQALMAVKNGEADYAVVPFYSPYAGYDFESLRAIGNLFTLRAVEQVEATDQLCLAVHESQVLELAQSSHPNSTLSHLLSRRRGGRADWGGRGSRIDIFNQRRDDTDADFGGDGPGGGDMHSGGLVIDQSMQMVLRDRLDSVFVDQTALRRCKSKLDGLRAAGVDVREIADAAEPHREFARMTRQSLNPDRVVNTYFNPNSGESHYVSAMNGGAQAQQLFGVVLPFEVADRSSEYIIIDPFLEDAEPGKTRFVVVQNNPDHTLYDDAYRTTDARTRYWFRRLKGVAELADGSGCSGVRVLFQFRRDGTAASIGDVENFLRNYGVRHATVRVNEDSEKDAPAPMVLDVEFDLKHFSPTLGSLIRMPLSHSVARGAIKKVYARWKNRGVTVLGAMPFDGHQLPKQKRRRWYVETVADWASDFVETMFIRFSRLLFFGAVFALVGYAAWWATKFFLGG